MRYSEQTGSFYPDNVQYPDGSIPEDVISVSQADFDAAMSRGPRDTLTIQNGKLVVIKWDGPTLDEAKSDLWRSVKSLRDQRIDGGCTVAGIGRFDTDPASRANINGAVTGALIAKSTGAKFAQRWKLADNSVVELTVDQVIAVGQAVLGHVAQCHARSQALGAEIARAADKSALEKIDITSGWPG